MGQTHSHKQFVLSMHANSECPSNQFIYLQHVSIPALHGIYAAAKWNIIDQNN